MKPDDMMRDIEFLSHRAEMAGGYWCGGSRNGPRSWGISSNAIVRYAYGGDQPSHIGEMPLDRGDYAACVRAVRSLPRHRRIPAVRTALRRAKEAYLRHAQATSWRVAYNTFAPKH